MGPEFCTVVSPWDCDRPLNFNLWFMLPFSPAAQQPSVGLSPLVLLGPCSSCSKVSFFLLWSTFRRRECSGVHSGAHSGPSTAWHLSFPAGAEDCILHGSRGKHTLQVGWGLARRAKLLSLPLTNHSHRARQTLVCRNSFGSQRAVGKNWLWEGRYKLP